MRGGMLRKRASFESRDPAAVDASGQRLAQWTAVSGGSSVPCDLVPKRGTEVVEAGGTQDRAPKELIVRSDSTSRSITTSHRVTVDGVTYNIRDIHNPDRRDRKLVMWVEEAPE